MVLHTTDTDIINNMPDPDRNILIGLLLLYTDPDVLITGDSLHVLASKLHVTDLDLYLTRLSLYRKCTNILLSLCPIIDRYMHHIVRIASDGQLRDISDLLDLPLYIVASDLVVHVATHVSSHQVVCTYNSYGLPIEHYDPSVHRIIIDRTGDGYYVQGINLDHKFHSKYEWDYTFPNSPIMGGWFVPNSHYADFKQMIGII